MQSNILIQKCLTAVDQPLNAAVWTEKECEAFEREHSKPFQAIPSANYVHEKAPTVRVPNSRIPTCDLAMQCADPTSFWHEAACAVRGGWAFQPKVVLVPKDHPMFSGSEWTVFEGGYSATSDSRSITERMKNDPTFSDMWPTPRETKREIQSSAAEAVAKLVAILNGGVAPHPRVWAKKLEALSETFSFLELRGFEDDLPTMHSLLDGLVSGADSDLIAALWSCVYDESVKLKATVRTEPTDYYAYLGRLIGDLSKALESGKAVPGRDPSGELLAAKILHESWRLAKFHGPIRGVGFTEEAANEFAMHVSVKVLLGQVTGDLYGFMQNDWKQYFSRDFLKKKGRKKHAPVNGISLAEFTHENDEHQNSFADHLLDLETSDTERWTAAAKIDEIWHLFSPEHQEALKTFANADWAAAGEVLGIKPEAIRKRLMRAATETVPGRDHEPKQVLKDWDAWERRELGALDRRYWNLAYEERMHTFPDSHADEFYVTAAPFGRASLAALIGFDWGLEVAA